MARTLDVAKRTAILEAAKVIFTRDGYATAKISDIAQEAGVAQGTLYLYYESKESLASAIGEELFSRLITQCASIIHKIETPDDVAALTEWALQVAVEEQSMLAMVRERKQGLKPEYVKLLRFVSAVGDALAALMARGTIRHYENVSVLAELVIALMRRLLTSQTVFSDVETSELKLGATEFLQHALFDDVTLAANKLIKRKQDRDACGD